MRADISDSNKYETRDNNLLGYVCDFDGACFRTLDRQRSSERSIPGGSLHPKYTLMHVAIDGADHLLAYEIVRHGFPVDTRNGKGQTPLLQALERLWDIHTLLKSLSNRALPKEVQGYKKGIQHQQSRIRCITVVLVEQYADVNATVKWQGRLVSSLHFACAIEDWELVAMLLNYGAQAKPTPACADAKESLATVAAKHRFIGLTAKAKGSTRPPRLCPCFSGESVSECHGTDQGLPLPGHFVCSCGSAKEYWKCCNRRNISLGEKWNEEKAAIVRVHFIPGPGASSFMLPKAQGAQAVNWKRGGIDKIISGGMKLLDPASYEIFDEAVDEWNKAVDKYIAQNVDSRPRFEIELAAKVGVSLGIMYRECEAEGCDKIEGRNLGKVSTCSQCQMAFYCGPTCQKSHWPTHKKICGSPDQTERGLPSQDVLSNFAVKYATIKILRGAGMDQDEVLREALTWDIKKV
ncbi:hypothetical protein B0H16DRAFT_1408516 [Mycena metata]|uniref:MYND-type domain-containing protein n=1 Tax=Mycena metata TaxID=1033252 RepID=A0AAD7JZN3_9AGAR|nr:hypothetical protein B0H16DRAFT_1408516 [Mycena metata]